MTVSRICVLCWLAISNITIAEDALPSIDDVVQRMNATNDLIKTIAVHEESTRRQRDFNGGEEVYQMQRTADWKLDREGRKYYVMEGKSLNFNRDGATYYPLKVEFAFDGKLARTRKFYWRNEAWSEGGGEVSSYMTYYTMPPTVFLTWDDDRSLLARIREGKYQVVGTKTHKGREVLNVHGPVNEVSGAFRNLQFLFDMERGVVVRKSYSMKQKLKDEWIDYAVWTGLEYQEVAPTVWLPGKYRKYSFHVKGDGSVKDFSDGYVGSYTDWNVNEEFPESQFMMTFREDQAVNDHREGGNGQLLSAEEIKKLNSEDH